MMSTDNMEEYAANWTSPEIAITYVGLKLVPFLKTVAMYFLLDTPSPSWFASLIKSLPVLCLCGFVLYHGISLGEKHAYARRILLGLLFSCIGDILLIWPCCFAWGMLSFAIGHLLYTSAFGMKPLNPIAGVVCGIAAIVGTLVLIDGCHGLYVVFVPIYIFLLMFMVWRAVARVQVFEDLRTWTKLCSLGGGILFTVSDMLIGINRFVSPVPYANILIMVSYYAAQLGITLSVVNSASIAVIRAAQSSDNNQFCRHLEASADQDKRPVLKGGSDVSSVHQRHLTNFE